MWASLRAYIRQDAQYTLDRSLVYQTAFTYNVSPEAAAQRLCYADHIIYVLYSNSSLLHKEVVNFLLYQPSRFNLGTNNKSLDFEIAYSTCTEVQFCMQMIRQSFPLRPLENRCVQTLCIKNCQLM